MQTIRSVSVLVRTVVGKHSNSIFLFSSVSSSVTTPQSKMDPNHNSKVLKRYDNIVQSEEDKRQYRGLLLANHMKVLLISDPTTDKSAAAIDVNVGYMCDPKELPGLAHFCEHMLFLGTEKYPEENDYNKFLSQHSGSSNAVTHPDHTTYFFDIVPAELPNAMDRFAQFFIAPLFTESATDREINAVNSEHEKNIQIDLWRRDQLDKHLADETHDFHKFGTGNRRTLEIEPKKQNIVVRDELLKFHDKWYSSNLMCLAVLGKESLDELETMVINLFSDVRNKSVNAPRWDKHPYSTFKTRVFVSPIKDLRSLLITFPCADLQKYYKSSPAHYVTHLMGHEGPGSILSRLKALGWSNNLVAGSRAGPRGIGFFNVTVDLTEEGINHIDDIVTLIFQYLNMLKNLGPQKWVHDENRGIGNMLFRFKDKESPRNYINTLVHLLQDYEMEDVLSCIYLLTEWRPDIIEEMWKDFVPENIRLTVIGKKFDEITDQVEPWYGTKYKLEPIPEETIQMWQRAGLNEHLIMPQKNEFIPTDFSIYPRDEALNHESPYIIQDNALNRVWFKQDDKYLLPKANIMFDFVSPLAYLDPLNCNLTHMLVQLFRDSLNEYGYAAELAGLKWELINTKYGLILGIGGYNDKQHILLEKIMEKLTNFQVDGKRFEIFKENYIRTLKNFFSEQPYQHAVYYLTVLLTESSWTKQELLAATEHLTKERLEAFIPEILSKMHIECFIHGNANQERALQLVKIVADKLCTRYRIAPLMPRQLLLNRELKLEDGCDYVYCVENNVHTESCIELYYQCGLQSIDTNMKMELLAQIVQEPCFNNLRTKQQLGYIVFSGIRRSNGVQGLRVIVQSEKHPQYLDERIEDFFTSMLTHIVEMNDDEFERHREALALHRLEKPKQLSAQTSLYWSEITSQQYHFNRAEVEVAYLRTITKNDLIAFYRKILDKNAPGKKKLAVYVISSQTDHSNSQNDNENEKCGNAEKIEDVTSFKSAHEMYALVQPYMNITRKGNKCKL